MAKENGCWMGWVWMSCCNRGCCLVSQSGLGNGKQCEAGMLGSDGLCLELPMGVWHSSMNNLSSCCICLSNIFGKLKILFKYFLWLCKQFGHTAFIWPHIVFKWFVSSIWLARRVWCRYMWPWMNRRGIRFKLCSCAGGMVVAGSKVELWLGVFAINALWGEFWWRLLVGGELDSNCVDCQVDKEAGKVNLLVVVVNSGYVLDGSWCQGPWQQADPWNCRM